MANDGVELPAGTDSMRCLTCGAPLAAGSQGCPGCRHGVAAGRTPLAALVAHLPAIVVSLGIGGVLVALLLPPVHRGREAPRRMQCKNNIHQIALALHNYADDYGALPPAYTVDHYGAPLHSWRTLILPYLDQRQLYEKIDLSKPWDDPANAEAFNTRVPIYLCPSDPGPSPNHTTYLASAGLAACFHPVEPRALSAITDGTSETLMIIEVPSENSVPWMSPNDADEGLILGIGGDSTVHTGGTHAALCDGSVRFISSTLGAGQRRALITAAAGDNAGEF